MPAFLSDQTVNPQINGATVNNTTATTTSCIVRPHNPGWSLQTKAVCTAGTITWKVEVSNDLVDWNDITSSFAPPLTNTAALTGTSLNFALAPPTAGGFVFLRITATCSAGSAVITVSVRSLPTGEN
jgi:hypothetical protein